MSAKKQNIKSLICKKFLRKVFAITNPRIQPSYERKNGSSRSFESETFDPLKSITLNQIRNTKLYFITVSVLTHLKLFSVIFSTAST